ncbi:serine/threonine-protein kinase mTOR-like [Clytia hemisphaerica]|uniref:serine/threonine-protein kinase mTOR-like n=1 Tax=Clytia hemisphaerica TaxID=252671 RepID=UPI0034D3C645
MENFHNLESFSSLATFDLIESDKGERRNVVIPQLIARIDTPRQMIGRLIHQLLSDVGKQHPQALIYPLTVASKSASADRRNAAEQILCSLREHSLALVEQAMMVSEELIRVTILWHELWAEGLEEASRLYLGERNVKGMFAVLDPLHQIMENGPQTQNEISFQQTVDSPISTQGSGRC